MMTDEDYELMVPQEVREDGSIIDYTRATPKEYGGLLGGKGNEVPSLGTAHFTGTERRSEAMQLASQLGATNAKTLVAEATVIEAYLTGAQ